jgi:putative heme iron utilization protein
MTGWTQERHGQARLTMSELQRTNSYEDMLDLQQQLSAEMPDALDEIERLQARAERTERVLRAIVWEDWETLSEMAGAGEQAAANCKHTVHSHGYYVLQNRENVIDGAAQSALDAIAEDDVG